jgi:hypothetical protein
MEPVLSRTDVINATPRRREAAKQALIQRGDREE